MIYTVHVTKGFPFHNQIVSTKQTVVTKLTWQGALCPSQWNMGMDSGILAREERDGLF